MDLKKVLDQTVRNMKREVNKKVLKVPEIERKVLEATCNEPWGPHGSLMADIAQATRNVNEYQMIMTVLWKRLNDSGRNWRHVYKSLTIMEFLVGHGADRFIDDLREHTYQIQTLVDFQYVDSSGRDQGLNVRKKAQAIVALINDKERIREVRQKAASNRDKYRGVSSVGGIYRSSSYSSTDGTYGDRDEDDRYGGSAGRYSGKDDRYYGERFDDKYSRDGDRYRDEDRYGGDRDRDGDRYSPRDRYSAKNDYNRSGYDDARSSGSKEEDDWRSERRQPKTSLNPPSYEDVSNQGDGEEKRNGELAAAVARATKLSAGENGSVPVQAENATANDKTSATNGFDEFDPRGGSIHVSASDQNLSGLGSGKLNSTLTAPATFMSAVEELFADSSVQSSLVPTSSTDFDTSNPFGMPEFRATSSDQNAAEPTGFASSNSTASSAVDVFGSSAFGAGNEQPATNASPEQFNTQQPQAFQQQQQHEDSQALALVPQQSVSSQQQPTQQPFPSQQPQSFPPQQPQSFPPQQPQSFPPQQPQSFPPQQPQSFPPQQTQSFPPQQTQSFPPQQGLPPQGQAQYFQQSFQSFPPQQQPQLQHHPQPFMQQPPQAFSSQPQPFPQQQSQSFPQQQPRSFLPQQQTQLQQPQSFIHQQQQPYSQQQPASFTKLKQQEKFQPKSAVWADTLSSGLVNLNIGPLKNDPLAELGIHLVESKVSASERRKEEKSSVPATKGKAMGSGSGLGLAVASVMPPPPPPPPPVMMGGGPGMGMNPAMMPGMGMGMNPAMMPGMGMGMNPPMMPGMGMGMNPAMMPGMNPAMARMGGGYSQQPQYGGYR